MAEEDYTGALEAYERAAEIQVSRGDIPGALVRAEVLTGVDREAGTHLRSATRGR